jgi:hypothetical protein
MDIVMDMHVYDLLHSVKRKRKGIPREYRHINRPKRLSSAISIFWSPEYQFQALPPPTLS